MRHQTTSDHRVGFSRIRTLWVFRSLCLGFTLLILGCGAKETPTPSSLRDTLEDKDPDMRYWAARELGKSPGPEVDVTVKALIGALSDENETVRMGAAYALRDIGPPAKAAIPSLKRLDQGSSKAIRDAVRYALERIQK